MDAIGIDKARSAVVLVQSKWDGDGKGSPALGDVQKFAQGFRDLITPSFDRFNAKIKARAADLIAALDNTDVRFELVVAHTGQQPLSSHAKRVSTTYSLRRMMFLKSSCLATSGSLTCTAWSEVECPGRPQTSR